MRIDCLACGQRELKDRNCFSALLRAFANEQDVDKIVLSNLVETQYFGKALSILKGITALSHEMANLGCRTPEMPSGAIPSACSDCEWMPRTLFGNLNQKFLSDVGQFYALFHDTTVRLQEFEPINSVCGKCILASREDFDYVFARFESILREIVKEGYAVVV